MFMSGVVLMGSLSVVVSIQLHIYLRGFGIEDAIKWSRQSCEKPKDEEEEGVKQRTKPLYPPLSHLSCLSPCVAFHTPLCCGGTGWPVRLYLSRCLPASPPLFTGRDACVWYDASACVSVIIVCSFQHSPSTCSPCLALHLTFTHFKTSLLPIPKVGQTSTGPLVESDD
ncbi:hypothetical protein XENOCAPTIV_007834 [Xenoophorus captivus]|uniref:Uncharacterized protein n=1 Tax=Xenoophorus captivus TaxID=1517983 RepID=A0ABV0SDY2_9TELE